MSLTLYAHPFSSYCQKVLMALYENAVPFTYRNLDDAGVGEDMQRLWPLGKFPVLTDGARTIVESSIILEYLDLHYPGPVRLLPQDPIAALEVRFMDRFFDNYVMTPMQKAVAEAIRPDGRKDTARNEARRDLDIAYAWLEDKLADRTWAAGADFTMADCAAAPSLFYADWVHEIGAAFPRLRAYRKRLLARPSMARAVDEARYFRKNFPLGAPDRD